MRQFFALALASLVTASLSLVMPYSAQAKEPEEWLVMPNLAQPFDWQEEWGSIHVNSYADGLNDPGIPSTANGVMPCAAGANLCGPAGITGGSVVHGIKYDIKNSVVNCAAIQLPTFPLNHNEAFMDYVCGLVGTKSYHDPLTLVYMPMTDERSLDPTYLTPKPGWQQLVINNCIRDIYGYDEGEGKYTPVYHVFSDEEKENWIVDKDKKGLEEGDQLPVRYYHYREKKESGDPGDMVLSSILPEKDRYVAGTLKTIDNSSEDLANIKAYKISNVSDSDSFIIVDPNPYYDMRQYNYVGSPTPYENCPVLGLKMYDGICDPTGYAGCNLPIYGVGPATTFTGQSTTYTFNNYPVIWAGYALAWSFITPEQYWAQVEDRKNIAEAHLYLEPLNDNPVLMLVRANSYCTYEEMTSNPALDQTDLPCIQYLQYETDGNEPAGGEFISLYNPSEDSGTVNDIAAWAVKHNYNVNADGSLGSAVLNLSGQPVSFFDLDATYMNAGTAAPAVERIQPPGQPVLDPGGTNPRPGTLMGDGAGIEFKMGTSIAVQLEKQTISWEGKEINCIEFTFDPGQKNDDVFVPTNTRLEFQSFANAVYAGMVSGNGVGGLNLSGKPCEARFKLYGSDTPTANPNGTLTWYGITNCSQIPSPSCNQVTTISAQRYCERSVGVLGDCGECLSASDPDGKLDPGTSGVISNYRKDANGGTNTCYFQAWCHTTNICPGLKSGGHVFCLSPETEILMADGTEKRIDSLKAGDEVMGFDAKRSRGALKKVKVKATAITKEQKLVHINDLKITPLHKIVLESGRAVMAKEIKVGDRILKANGLVEEVMKVDMDNPPTTVHNLSLVNADGYIAGGVRVLEYPVPSDLVQ